MLRKCLKLFAVCALAALLVIWGQTMKSDMNLTFDLVRGKKEIFMEIGGFSAVRFFGEDEWDLNAEGIVRKTPVEELHGVHVKIDGPSGLRTINSPRGAYDGSKNQLVLFDADGVWKREEYPLEWSSPHVQWDEQSETWDFPDGVVISGDVYAVTGKSAVMKNGHEIHVEDGCLRWWK
ncbi:MAG: hypothetical protein SOZ52_03670 [Pyramidobacter sp.]|nr:hypothetical protein [Pyramidobacter sp.]